MKRPYSIILFLLGILLLSSQIANASSHVLVRIYTSKTITNARVMIDLGKYNLIADDNQTISPDPLKKGEYIDVKNKNGKLQVQLNGKPLGGDYAELKIKTSGFKNIVRTILPGNTKDTRTYDDNLIIRPLGKENLILLNDVDLENYIAGVVQSEIYTITDSTDIFKLQAIISRTYALKNLRKHEAEKFNLCDDVHCQAYYNRCTKATVLKGAIDSRGEILVDTAGNMVETPFHSNSGGYTANSEDVWNLPVYYLRSIKDTFSTQMKNAKWEKEIPIDDWLSYFKKNYTLNTQEPSIREELLSYKQDERKSKICNIPLKQIRTDFKLRSTYFSVQEKSGKVILSGCGFGHGVGLSQEGAICMIQHGFSYKDVLLFYYHNVRLIQVSEDSIIENKNK